MDIEKLDKEVYRNSTWYIDSTGQCVGRTCTKCRLAKPRNDFYPAKNRKYGVGTTCKDCSRSEANKRYRKKSGRSESIDNETILSVEGMLGASELSAVYMQERNGLRGIYFVDSDDVCLAKTCSSCLDILPARSFNIINARHRGLSNMCKDCNKISSKEYGDQPATEGGITLRAEGLRKYYEANRKRPSKEVYSIREALYPSGSKECGRCHEVKALDLFYRSSITRDGLSHRCGKCSDEAKRAGEIGRHVQHWDNQGIPVKCYITGEVTNLHLDHVIPKRLGGSDDSSNILPLRADLNMSKGKKPLYEWMMGRDDIPDPDSIIQKLIKYGVDPFPT